VRLDDPSHKASLWLRVLETPKKNSTPCKEPLDKDHQPPKQPSATNTSGPALPGTRHRPITRTASKKAIEKIAELRLSPSRPGNELHLLPYLGSTLLLVSDTVEKASVESPRLYYDARTEPLRAARSCDADVSGPRYKAS